MKFGFFTVGLVAAGFAFGVTIASAQSVTLKMATDSGAKGSAAGNALDNWAAMIEEGTNGDVEVKVFYQNELGGQQEVFDLLVANDVQVMLNWPITSYDERIAVL